MSRDRDSYVCVHIYIYVQQCVRMCFDLFGCCGFFSVLGLGSPGPEFCHAAVIRRVRVVWDRGGWEGVGS